MMTWMQADRSSRQPDTDASDSEPELQRGININNNKQKELRKITIHSSETLMARTFASLDEWCKADSTLIRSTVGRSTCQSDASRGRPGLGNRAQKAVDIPYRMRCCPAWQNDSTHTMSVCGFRQATKPTSRVWRSDRPICRAWQSTT